MKLDSIGYSAIPCYSRLPRVEIPWIRLCSVKKWHDCRLDCCDGFSKVCPTFPRLPTPTRARITISLWALHSLQGCVRARTRTTHTHTHTHTKKKKTHTHTQRQTKHKKTKQDTHTHTHTRSHGMACHGLSQACSVTLPPFWVRRSVHDKSQSFRVSLLRGS